MTLALEDTGQPVTKLDGFSGLETAWVILTHPLVGVFHRRDGNLGMYHIWHDRLFCTTGRVLSARIGLFDRLGIVPRRGTDATAQRPHPTANRIHNLPAAGTVLVTWNQVTPWNDRRRR